MRKMINQKGVFLTFIAFLLVSTLLVLDVATKQSDIGLGKNLADHAALKEVDGIFSNIRQQIIVAKEGTASAAYGRLMPFKKFRADSNSIELEQNLPLEGKYLENMYDAINLFAIFAGEKGDRGAHLKVWSLLQNSRWNAEETEQYPRINYAILPQCLRFSASKDATGGIFDENIVFSKGTAGEECQEAFQASSIASYEIEIRVPDVVSNPACQNAFAGCSENPDSGQTAYARILLIWENCELDCETYGFKTEGKKIIAANLSQSGTEADLVEIETSAGETVSVRFNQPGSEEDEVLKIGIQSEEEPLAKSVFKAKITFNKAIDEIKLLPPGFDFGVRKQGFDYCRATSEEACAFEAESDDEPTGECTTSLDCDDSEACTIDTCTDGACSNTPITACINGDGCCPTVCTYADDNDCPDTSLVAYYKFDEDSGTTAADSSGNGNNGTLLPAPPNGPEWQTTGCHSGNCLKFDGINDYVSVNNNIANNYPITVSYWVKFSSTTPLNQVQFALYGTNFWFAGGFALSPPVYLTGIANLGANSTAVAALDRTNWNFITVVQTSASSAKVYFNGVDVTSATGNSWGSRTSSSIGARTGTYPNPTNGAIDEVRIYNRVLSPAEILALYNQ